MSAEKQIIKMFIGVTPSDTEPNCSDFQNISVGNYDPPAYIVQIILLGVLGLPDYGPEEKVRWRTVFNYKGKTFLIRDYKFGTWSVNSNTTDETTKEIVSEIKGKIRKASNNMDKVLQQCLKSSSEKGDFFIKNVDQTLDSIFWFFHSKAADAITDVRKIDDSVPGMSRQDLINKKWKLTESAFCYVYATINAFYSYSEFIFDLVYAFEQPDIDFWSFRNKDWRERCKLVFDVSDKEFKKIYDNLLKYKKGYRNPLSHGFTHEMSVLVPLPKIGLVPISYQFLSNELYYGVMGLNDISVAEHIIETFTSFFDYIRKKQPYNYYIRYAECGFEIPIKKEIVNNIKKEMSSPEDFEEYLKQESYYMDAVINRDI